MAIPVQFLLKTLGDFLVDEIRLQRSVGPELENIMLELQNMRSLLKDADSRLLTNRAPDSVKEWVEQVRSAAYDIEDMLDEFMLHCSGPFEFGTLTFFLNRSCIVNLKKWRGLAMMIEKMKRSISAISARRDRYNLIGLEGMSPMIVESEQLRTANEAHNAEYSHIEGIGGDIDILMKWAESGDREPTTILLVGMGGSGKTTLARKVYDKLKRKSATTIRKAFGKLMGGSFDCFAWVPVTRSFNAEHALRHLLDVLEVEDGLPAERDVTSLGEAVRRHLHNRRYVIVLDDVWSSDVLNTIGFAFPMHDRQCRLIITSRLEKVASGIEVETLSPFKVHRLKPLKPKDSMKVFCRNAFRDAQEHRCPEHLQETCEKLVDRCDGLPLALVCLGAVISRRERTQLEWSSFYDGLPGELNANPELGRVRGIFSLSYDELPIHLKACFLYCGIFPKNYLITANKLIRLWVGEGFVEEKEGMTLEQVGKQYIEQLTQRSLLLVVERNEKGSVKTCQMHALLRELMLPTAKRQGLSKIIYGNCGFQDHAFGAERSRSLSLIGATDQIIREMYSHGRVNVRRVRSLLMFDSPSIPSMVHKLNLLRVLDLQGVFIEELPPSIGHLYHLRYLNLRNTHLKRIPKSLGKLHNLQALDIRDNQIEKLPSLSKVRKLRYVSAYSHWMHPFTISQLAGCDFPSQICESEGLQKLSGINASNKIIETIGNLIQLKHLGIYKVKEEHGKKLCASIEKMRKLLSLGISSNADGECLRLHLLTTPPPHLEDIWLFGRIERFPHWVERVNNLRRLGLYFSKLHDSPIPCLQELPSLEWLKLYDAYEGMELKFEGANHFSKLKTLMILKLFKLRSIVVSDGALPQLQTLSICECPELKRIPDHRQLTKLESLHLRGMPHYTFTTIPEQQDDQYFVAKIHLYKGSDGKFHKQVSN